MHAMLSAVAGSDEKLREKLGLVGKDRIQSHLNWEASARNLVTAYDQLELIKQN